MNQKTIDFITENADSDTARLLLSAPKYSEEIDLRAAVRCIEARKKMKNKVPLWYESTMLEYPESLPLEQCSSQATAQYKRRFVTKDDIVADLTGGLGIDTYFLSLTAGRIDYYERNEVLAYMAKSNFKALSACNIFVNSINIDVFNIDNELVNRHYDLVYADPARRSKKGGKIVFIKDCEPDITQIKGSLFNFSDKILVKLSPMIDLSIATRELPETTQIHILSVDNECKEVLLFLDKNSKDSNSKETPIHCVNMANDGSLINEIFTYTTEEELLARASFINSHAPYTESFLYEPNRSILKAGAFKLISKRYGVMKLSTSTHLYISPRYDPLFPGKVYRISDICDFNKKSIKNLAASYPTGSVTARNFPLSSDALKLRLGIKDGEGPHLFATTLEDGSKRIFVTNRLLGN